MNPTCPNCGKDTLYALYRVIARYPIAELKPVVITFDAPRVQSKELIDIACDHCCKRWQSEKELLRGKTHCTYKMVDFSISPGGRYIKHGPSSGEEFRKTVLLPLLQKYKTVEIDLDGTYGYPLVFLRGAFVDLLDDYLLGEIKYRLTFISREKPSLPRQIQGLIIEEGRCQGRYK